MPFLELKCVKCGHEFEELVPVGKTVPCPKCGGETAQKYSGKMWVNSVKKNGCSGNCSTCGGCK